MRPIATDTNDFPSLRRDGKIYVDKTGFVHRMVSDVNTRLFFVSRPRRFGKSLTLSVLKALFAGRRELFEGLYIDKTDWKWEKYPVIHFEFNDVTTTSIADFETSFAIHVQERLEKAGFAYDKSLPPPENFGNAIESLSAANGGKGVVILIDEYDAPVQRTRGHRGEAQEGHIHLRAEGRRAGGRGIRADAREGLRRAVPRRRTPDLAGWTLLRLQDPPPRRLRR